MRWLKTSIAYLVPTFALGYLWHLVWFADRYRALEIYRADPIVPLGFLSMLVQAGLFAWIFERAFAPLHVGWLDRGLRYAAAGAALSWSFTTLAAGAKHLMTSVPDFLLIETAFTAAQWMLVGPLTAFVRSADAVRAPARGMQ